MYEIVTTTLTHFENIPYYIADFNVVNQQVSHLDKVLVKWDNGAILNTLIKI